MTTLFEDITESAALSDHLGPGTAVPRNFARNREALMMPSLGAADRRAADKRSRESEPRTATSPASAGACKVPTCLMSSLQSSSVDARW